MGSENASSLIRLLKQKGIDSLHLMDVGAKDFLEEIPALRNIIRATGFEPHPKEFKKLLNKYSNWGFADLSLENCCLSDQDGDSDFLMTEHASMSSLFEADMENYQLHFGQYTDFEQWKKNIQAAEKIRVECRTLNDYAEKKGLDLIDFLKLDTQGSELKILQGASKLLDDKRILCMKIEACTVQIYKDQALFTDIDLFLREKGYVLVDLITYRRTYEPVYGKPQERYTHHAPCLDAIYIAPIHELNAEQRIRLSVFLLWLGYYSTAKSCVELSGMSEKEAELLLQFDFRTRNQIFKKLIRNNLPPSLFHWLKKWV